PFDRPAGVQSDGLPSVRFCPVGNGATQGHAWIDSVQRVIDLSSWRGQGDAETARYRTARLVESGRGNGRQKAGIEHVRENNSSPLRHPNLRDGIAHYRDDTEHLGS